MSSQRRAGVAQTLILDVFGSYNNKKLLWTDYKHLTHQDKQNDQEVSGKTHRLLCFVARH